jgi:hypothetical protein
MSSLASNLKGHTPLLCPPSNNSPSIADSEVPGRTLCVAIQENSDGWGATYCGLHTRIHASGQAPGRDFVPPKHGRLSTRVSERNSTPTSSSVHGARHIRGRPNSHHNHRSNSAKACPCPHSCRSYCRRARARCGLIVSPLRRVLRRCDKRGEEDYRCARLHSTMHLSRAVGRCAAKPRRRHSAGL